MFSITLLVVVFRFNISEGGAHAGVVIFSDLNNYTRVEIRMRDYLNTKDFNEAVRNIPFIGFRTRMDLAFKLTHEQLLTKAGGMCDLCINSA